MLNKNSIQIRNPTYKADTELTVKFCRMFALMMGLWPTTDRDSIFQRFIKTNLHVLFYCIMLFIYISAVLHIIFVLVDLHAKLVVVGPITFWTMAMAKYTLFWKRSNNIKDCLKIIEEDWQNANTPEHRETMMKSAKFGNYITIICTSFMYAGGLSYHIIGPFMAEPIVTAMNISVKPFPTPVYGKVLTSGLSPTYEIVFTIQMMAGFIMYTMAIMSFSLTAVMITHACGQFDVIILHINNLVSGRKEYPDTICDRLSMTIQHHSRVLSFTSLLEDLLNEVGLIEVVGCTVNLCLLGYYLIMAFKETEYSGMLTYGFLILYFTFNIFIYCYTGELLTLQAIKVGECTYMTEWYNLPNNNSLDLIFLIKISQFPAKITAGKFTALSLYSFSTIIKTSAAYFNFVWKLTQ